MNEQRSSAHISHDGTICSFTCGHPHCWNVLRNVNRSPTWSSEPSKSRSISTDGEGLPTVKVFNVLDDYGESSGDLYPSKFGGRASHQRTNQNALSNERVTRRKPQASPYRHGAASKSSNSLSAPLNAGRDMHSIEVQEVFDMQELTDDWDQTFVTRPVYVWVEGAAHRKMKRRKELTNKGLSLNRAAKGPEVVTVKNLTNDLIPPPPLSGAQVVERYLAGIDAVRKDAVDKAPLPTGGQPYPNVGQTPRDRRQHFADELKDLPKDFLIEILEKTKGLSSTDELIGLVEKYVNMMPKTRQDFEVAIGNILQQKKLQPAEAMWLSSLPMPAVSQKVYQLDASSKSAPFSVRKTYGLSQYSLLPGIPAYDQGRRTRATRVYTNLGAVRPAIKPFNYDVSSADFGLGPVYTPPLSSYGRRSQSTRSAPVDLYVDKSDAVADSESIPNSMVSPFREFKEYVGATASAAITSASTPSSGHLLPKPPVSTPYTTYTRSAMLLDPQSDHYVDGVDLAAARAAALDPDDPAAFLRAMLTSDYWNDVRHHALLTAIEEADEHAADGRTHKSLSVDASKHNDHIARAFLVGGIRTRSPINRAGSHKTSAKSLAGSPILKETEDILDADRDLAVSPQATRSVASNWPQIDEEELMREMSAVESPSQNGEARHRLTRPVHVPTGDFETVLETRQPTPSSPRPTIGDTSIPEMVDMVTAPVPPPPSPEPQERPHDGGREATFEPDDRSLSHDKVLVSQSPLPSARSPLPVTASNNHAQLYTLREYSGKEGRLDVVVEVTADPAGAGGASD